MDNYKKIPVKQKDPLEERITEELDAYEGGNHNHPKKQFGYFTVCGLLTGCGLGQLFGVMYLNSMSEEARIQKMAEIKAHCKKDGIGTLICTLGSTTYSHEKHVLEAGFTFVREYPNEKHKLMGYKDHKQKLYILTF